MNQIFFDKGDILIAFPWGGACRVPSLTELKRQYEQRPEVKAPIRFLDAPADIQRRWAKSSRLELPSLSRGH